MTILLLIAAALLVLSAALFFGPQLVIYGPAGLRDAARRPEAQFVGGCILSALALLFFAPLAGSALISGGETVQVVVTNLLGRRFV